MSQSASSKPTTLSCCPRKMNRCTTSPPTENIIAPPPPSTGSAVSNLYRHLQSATDRIVQQSVNTLYPFISSATVVPLTPVRGPIAVPVTANTPTGQIEQRIISSERSTLVTGSNCQRDFEIMITEIKVEYQTVFGMHIWNKFLETKTIETSMSGIHLIGSPHSIKQPWLQEADQFLGPYQKTAILTTSSSLYHSETLTVPPGKSSALLSKPTVQTKPSTAARNITMSGTCSETVLPVPSCCYQKKHLDPQNKRNQNENQKHQL